MRSKYEMVFFVGLGGLGSISLAEFTTQFMGSASEVPPSSYDPQNGTESVDMRFSEDYDWLEGHLKGITVINGLGEIPSLFRNLCIQLKNFIQPSNDSNTERKQKKKRKRGNKKGVDDGNISISSFNDEEGEEKDEERNKEEIENMICMMTVAPI